MPPNNVFTSTPWIWGGDEPKTLPMQFFEAYGRAVNSRTFLDTPMTKWYGPSTKFHSETGKIFHGAEEMAAWMSELFFSFERVDHTPMEYVEISQPDGTSRVFATFDRRLWMKGNHSSEPDTSTPMAWHCYVGKAETGFGHLGLQFLEVHLFWDKTKTVQLLQKSLPSDEPT